MSRLCSRLLRVLLVWPAHGALLLGRQTLLRRFAAPAAVTGPLWLRPPRASAGEPARSLSQGETYYQSDDKSFDFIAPKGWAVPEAGFNRDGVDPRRLFPEHLFVVTAKGGSDSVEVTVDLGFGLDLKSLGKSDDAAQRLLAYLPGPPARVKSLEMVSGVVKGSSYLLLKTEDGRTLKAAVVQKKLFAMAGSGQGAQAVLDTFQVWPTNIFCQGASNKGGPIVQGTCY